MIILNLVLVTALTPPPPCLTQHGSDKYTNDEHRRDILADCQFCEVSIPLTQPSNCERIQGEGLSGRNVCSRSLATLGNPHRFRSLMFRSLISFLVTMWIEVKKKKLLELFFYDQICTLGYSPMTPACDIISHVWINHHAYPQGST